MSKSKRRVEDFNLAGQLLGFVIKDGYKVKYLRMIVNEVEYWIKLSKEIRRSLDPRIFPGCWLEIEGTKELNGKNGKVKYKADSVILKIETDTAKEAIVPIKTKKAKSKAKVLICQKSSCKKRGAKKVCEALEKNLRDRGIAEEVTIKSVGCLKECKKGPNLVLMPDKVRYSKVNAQKVPDLIEKHLASPVKDNQS